MLGDIVDPLVEAMKSLLEPFKGGISRGFGLVQPVLHAGHDRFDRSQRPGDIAFNSTNALIELVHSGQLCVHTGFDSIDFFSQLPGGCFSPGFRLLKRFVYPA